MKKVMKIAAMAVCAGTMLGIAGCGNGNSNTPDAVALEVFEKVYKDTATKEYLNKKCTTESAKFFTMFGNLIREGAKGGSLSVVDVKINGNDAIVRLKQEGCANADTWGCPLLKVDGEWKVNQTK
jgi:hypothetical protein